LSLPAIVVAAIASKGKTSDKEFNIIFYGNIVCILVLVSVVIILSIFGV